MGLLMTRVHKRVRQVDLRPVKLDQLFRLDKVGNTTVRGNSTTLVAQTVTVNAPPTDDDKVKLVTLNHASTHFDVSLHYWYAVVFSQWQQVRQHLSVPPEAQVHFAHD